MAHRSSRPSQRSTLRSSDDITLAAALAQYRTSLLAAQRRPATLACYETRFTLFQHWCAEQRVSRLAQVDVVLVEQFFAYLQTYRTRFGRPTAPSTVHGFYVVLKGWFGYCRRRGLMAENPLADMPAPRIPTKSKTVLSAEDVDRLLDACAPELPGARRGGGSGKGSTRNELRNRALILFLWDTGCRIGELCSLTFGDLDWSSGAVTFGWDATKGRADRTVRLSDNVLEELNAYVERERVAPAPGAEEVVFLSETGKPLSLRVTNKSLRRIAAKAGLTVYLTHHLFRHSHITMQLALNLANEAQIGYDVGHKSRNTTAIYTHFAEAYQRQGLPGSGLGALVRTRRGAGRPRRTAAPAARDRWGRRATG